MAGPLQSQFPYLPIEFDISTTKDAKDVQQLIAKRERLTAQLLNIKENAIYDLVENQTGQKWFSTTVPPQPKIYRYGYRMVINIGALPNTGTKTVAHGIPVGATYIFTHIYGCATNPATKFAPLPYVNVAVPADGVELWADATNVYVKTTTANWIAYSAYAVLEYLKG